FELDLGPGAGRPPTHTHDEGEEHIEVLEGEIVFRVNGEERRLGAGDTLTLSTTDAHTFWNPSKTASVRARVTHGARFERLLAQPSLLAMLVHMAYVDPGSSRPASRLMRLMVRLAAWFARLRGVETREA